MFKNEYIAIPQVVKYLTNFSGADARREQGQMVWALGISNKTLHSWRMIYCESMRQNAEMASVKRLAARRAEWKVRRLSLPLLRSPKMPTSIGFRASIRFVCAA